MLDLDMIDPLADARERLLLALKRPQSRHTYPLPTTPRLGAPDDLHAAGGDASLYIHIPYCSVRCTYCFFVTQIGHGADDMARYVDEAIEEIRLHGPGLGNYRFTSLYYGGGTPGLLPVPLFERLHAALAPWLAPGATVTMETHPHAADAHRIKAWREAGIDRVSMGVQTTDSDLLELINRDMTEVHILPAISRLLSAGFDDVNVDLLYGLPQQDMASWRETLEAIMQTGIPSISAYRTAFIPDTLAAFEKRGAKPPRAADVRPMYDLAFDLLNEAGYDQPRYGCSTFSKLPYDYGLNLHRQHVLDGKPMVGLGMGAYGSLAGHTYMNARERNGYQKAIAEGKPPVFVSQPVPEAERPYKYATEAWKLGFLSGDRYAGIFDEAIEARFGYELAVLIEAGEIDRVGEEYRFTRQGAQHPDVVAELFLSPAARAWADRQKGK